VPWEGECRSEAGKSHTYTHTHTHTNTYTHTHTHTHLGGGSVVVRPEVAVDRLRPC
jgi:hypothetical protein